MIVTGAAEREALLVAGARCRTILETVGKGVRAGVSTAALDRQARALIAAGGDTSAFLNYRPAGKKDGYPAVLCVSINDEMVHGVPSDGKIIADGDVVTVDCGLNHNGLFVDAAYTTVVGAGDAQARELVEATRRALRYALVFARAGGMTGDIGSAVETVATEYGFTIPPELGGHGVGRAPHEEPFIPNLGDPGQGDVLRNGEVIAIEPIFSEGADPRITRGGDGFVYCTADGARAAHFEHTVLVTDGAPIVVTGALW